MKLKDDRQEIDSLIIDYLTDEIDKNSLEKLMQWCKASQQNIDYFHKYIELWFSTGIIDDDNVFNSDKAYNDFLKRKELGENRCKHKNIYSLRHLWWVASIVLILMLITFKMRDCFYKADTKLITINTPLGSHSNIELPDGTKIWLNNATTLSYSREYGVKDRNIIINGEGYFEVAHNKKIPFIIKSEKMDLKVLGTKFNYSNYSTSNKIIVSLIDGRVELKNNECNNLFYLYPNQKLIFNKINGRIYKGQTNSKNSILWIKDELLFDEDRLDEIIQKLEMAYNVKIELSDSLKAKRFYGNFNRSKYTIDELLNILSKTNYIKYIHKDNKYIVYSSK